MLATYTVETNLDIVDLSDNIMSLREAIFVANSASGADRIEFSESLRGTTILLEHGELRISSSMTIEGLGADQLTIDGSENYWIAPLLGTRYGYRVFNVDDGDGASLAKVTITGLTIKGGKAGVGPFFVGGGILNFENLDIENSVITGNSAFQGGGIANLGGLLSVVCSEVDDNYGSDAAGIFNSGGGTIHIKQSVIANNSTDGGYGGGIYSDGKAVISNSLVSGNAAFYGAGIWAAGELMIHSSTFRLNQATNGWGGGVFFATGDCIIEGCTFTENTAFFGGAIAVRSYPETTDSVRVVRNCTISSNITPSGSIFVIMGSLLIEHSTITQNGRCDGIAGGVVASGFNNVTVVELYSSIVAGNLNGDVAQNYVGNAVNTFISNGFNVIGFGNAAAAFSKEGDQTGIADPGLAVLANNGGPTLTHALAAGSPAIDAGNPAEVAGEEGAPRFDQRGNGFIRIFGRTIDVGAFESILLGDFNHDGNVDSSDYTVWRNTLGNEGLVPYQGADGNGDGRVGPEDYQVWKAHYGESLPALGGAGFARVDDTESFVDGVSVASVSAVSEATASVDDEPLEAIVGIASGSSGSTLARENRRPVGSRLVGAGKWNVVARDDALAAWAVAKEQRATDRRLADDGWETLEANEQDEECEAAVELDTVFELVGDGEGGV